MLLLMEFHELETFKASVCLFLSRPGSVFSQSILTLPGVGLASKQSSKRDFMGGFENDSRTCNALVVPRSGVMRRVLLF